VHNSLAVKIYLVRTKRRRVSPLHDIAITNIVWCVAYKRGSGRVGGRILRKSCNSIAIVWAMQVGGGNIMVIDSCTIALK